MTSFSPINPIEPAEEFVTLTLENVAEQCDAVLAAVRPRRGNFYTVTALISAYCGLLIYRAYRYRRAKLDADAKKAIELGSQVVHVIGERPILDEMIMQLPASLDPMPVQLTGILELGPLPVLSLQAKRFISDNDNDDDNVQEPDAQSKPEDDQEDADDALPERDHPFINVH